MPMIPLPRSLQNVTNRDPVWKRILVWRPHWIVLLLMTCIIFSVVVALGYYYWVIVDRATAGMWQTPSFVDVINDPSVYWGRPTTSTQYVFPIAPPPAPDMRRMKRQGCVTDGLLSGYGDEKRNAKLVNSLPCYYLHRAVETWLDTPNWVQVEDIKADITRTPIVYGMFIAEALDTKG